MTDSDTQPIVDTAWLADHLTAPDVIIFDVSWYLPTAGRNGHQEYLKEHIPGAQFLDINEICDDTSDLPHMLPSTVKFASFMKKHGVGDGVHVVCYDAEGIFAAARVWWMLRVMGHRDVSVLNGGMKKWKADGYEVTDDIPAQRPRNHFTPCLQNVLVAGLDDMKSLSEKAQNGGGQIVDARPYERFCGKVAEPRPGLQLGHIPGSKNIPYSSVLNEDGTMKSKEELIEIFKKCGIDPNKNVTTTCGSGVSAAVLALALAVIGNETVPVYDGSWAEWGDPDRGLPVATGG